MSASSLFFFSVLLFKKNWNSISSEISFGKSCTILLYLRTYLSNKCISYHCMLQRVACNIPCTQQYDGMFQLGVWLNSIVHRQSSPPCRIHTVHVQTNRPKVTIAVAVHVKCNKRTCCTLSNEHDGQQSSERTRNAVRLCESARGWTRPHFHMPKCRSFTARLNSMYGYDNIDMPCTCMARANSTDHPALMEHN